MHTRSAKNKNLQKNSVWQNLNVRLSVAQMYKPHVLKRFEGGLARWGILWPPDSRALR